MGKTDSKSLTGKNGAVFFMAAAFLAVAIAFLILAFLPKSSDLKDARSDLARRMKGMHSIHTLLNAWAADNDQTFPNFPGDANANFRALFQAGLTTDESIFGIPNDGWCDAGKPDGNIGQAPEFANALEPGEVSYAYVTGYDGSSATKSPLIIAGGGPTALGWITGVSGKPVVVYRGPVVVVTVGGATRVLTPDEDGKITHLKNGKKVDIFSAAYGFDPTAVRLPAPAKNKVKKPG